MRAAGANCVSGCMEFWQYLRASLSWVFLRFTIVKAGYPAFSQTFIQLDIRFDPPIVDPDGNRERAEYGWRELQETGYRVIGCLYFRRSETDAQNGRSMAW